jgi:protein ImuB
MLRLTERTTEPERRTGASPSDRAGEPPLVFTVKERGAYRLHALDEDALAMGLEPGMALADARARLPDLRAVPHDPDAERLFLERLADLCDRFTPMVAIAPPEGLVLDIEGCVHLFGSEAALARDAVRLMRAQGLRVRCARAATPEAALALARLEDINPLPPGGGGVAESLASATPATPVVEGYPPRKRAIPLRQRKALPPPLAGEDRKSARHSTALTETERLHRLPLLALRVDADVRHALRRAGFITIGDLAPLPAAPLAARFGSGLVDALGRLLGRIDSRITPRRLPAPIRVERRFAEPVARVETVMAVLGDLLAQACAALAERHQGGRRFAARLYRSDGATRDLAVETGQPVRDPAVVLRLFEERIEALSDPLDPGFGFDIVRLSVPIAEGRSDPQATLDGDPARDADLAALLDRLSVRAGAQRYRRLVPRDTHIPERATRLARVSEADPPLWDAALPDEPPLRPLTLLDPPERIEVMAQVPDGPPRQFRWRGSVHRIARQEGPERIAPEWWRRRDGYSTNPGFTRDYYRVEDEAGRRYWVFRLGLYERETEQPDWYVHGLFA